MLRLRRSYRPWAGPLTRPLRGDVRAGFWQPERSRAHGHTDRAVLPLLGSFLSMLLQDATPVRAFRLVRRRHLLLGVEMGSVRAGLVLAVIRRRVTAPFREALA